MYRSLRVTDAYEETPGFRIIRFGDGHGISYEPGQYLTLVRIEAGEEVRRSYSILSLPSEGESLAIGVKRVANGLFSRWLVDTVTIGDEVTTTGAAGFFTLPEKVHDGESLVFFAAGSGITPVYALVRRALACFPEALVVLAYSSPSAEQTPFLSELALLAKQYLNRIRIDHFFSNERDLSRARLHREEIRRYASRYGSRSWYFACGPESYLRLCTYTLQESGVARDRIRRENFGVEGLKQPVALPPDKEDRIVMIRWNGEERSVLVRYPESILRACKKAGINLPYSCEAGRCGQCVARCTRGKVWLAANEVLTDTELEKGLVLTCVGHPAGGPVTLETGTA
ncbi:MAG: ferredoxin--NADP reductase [Flaviaesturariibacter sp.]|nr:ferredoxin--NADP reductase [Flaviaesturariibacter sp.]